MVSLNPLPLSSPATMSEKNECSQSRLEHGVQDNNHHERKKELKHVYDHEENDHASSITITPTTTPIIPSTIPTQTQNINDTPPDGGYGWICCLACSLINGFTWGVMASYGVYLSYYLEHNTFAGTTQVGYAFIGGANFATAMLVAPGIGWIVKVLGTNVTIGIGCFVYAGGWIAASFARVFWEAVLSQGVMVGLGVGLIWMPSVPVLPSWFKKRRSLAQGIASAGSGFGGLIFSLATTPMIERLGLPWALRVTGLTTFVVLMIAALIIKDRNRIIKPKIHPFDVSLLKSYRICLLLGWSVFSILGYIVLLYSLSSYGLSIGLTQKQGGIIIALQNLGTGVGRPFVGVASDKLGRMTVAFALTAFTGIISFAIWIPASSYGVLILFALISGATIGTFWATIAPIAAEIVDLNVLPTMLSMTWIFISMPTLFSEAIALELRRPESGRPYLYPQIYAGSCYIVAAALMAELRRSKWGLWKRERHH